MQVSVASLYVAVASTPPPFVLMHKLPLTTPIPLFGCSFLQVDHFSRYRVPLDSEDEGDDHEGGAEGAEQQEEEGGMDASGSGK